jgi:hypothetical protein
MFLYICFDIQKKKKLNQSVVDRRRKWRTESKILRELQIVNLQVAFDMRYGESSHSHQLQNSLRRSLCDSPQHAGSDHEKLIQSKPEREREREEEETIGAR